ncbi:probable methyltransferase PMT19 [Impatiens glandulifera]|uniref:probable methyltransferase PMT19 n=1 Tax=Impatiens glandulifera TaxID=253017 RepID=UPI001FB0E19F|nr:probable methyltransferase PMT19 [Impatiens glandulifera]
MVTPPAPAPTLSGGRNPLMRPFIEIILLSILCFLSYIFGSQNLSSSSFIQDPSSCFHIKNLTNLQIPTLEFEPHHFLPLPEDQSPEQTQFFPFCPDNFTDYCPCQDPYRANQFIYSAKYFFHRERHCPDKSETLRCLIPSPKGYRKPFPWPKSRDYAWFNNVPFPSLTELKKQQNWVQLKGDRLLFPGGGTSFVEGVKGYVDDINRIVPLKNGLIRTVLDIGCGVASFGAHLMDYNILTMSVAPRDIHEAQVQFALERGVPAILGILGVHRLPFPSRSFDMSHCSRCLVPWTDRDGLYLLEIDRVLRPGGYWVLSGPPINWRVSYKGWNRTREDLENEQNRLEDIARRLCWRKVKETGTIAVWQKPKNHIHCSKKLKTWKSLDFCSQSDPDSAWYRKMEPCITPLQQVTGIKDTSGGVLEKWPKRSNVFPHRAVETGMTKEAFYEYNREWRNRVSYYGIVIQSLFTGKYRNIMDMNAGMGGFAAALSKYPVWVMNVVPHDTGNNTLGAIYERGFIGTYMNWCEPFSTYPRTYDLIHADNIFSMYLNKCDISDILFEMYRMLRPEGAIVIRDHVDMIVKIRRITERMRWESKLSHSQRGPLHSEKILFVGNSL